MNNIITTYEQYEVNVGLAHIALTVQQGVVNLDNIVTKILDGRDHSVRVEETGALVGRLSW